MKQALNIFRSSLFLALFLERTMWLIEPTNLISAGNACYSGSIIQPINNFNLQVVEMNVVIVALHRPVKPTGVCRHAVNIASCITHVHLSATVTLVVGSWQVEYFRSAFDTEDPSINILSVDIDNSPLSRNKWYISDLPKIIESLGADLVHMSFPLPFVKSWVSPPIVTSIHDMYPYECPENFGFPQVFFNRFFLWLSVQTSDSLACVSKCTLNSLNKYLPKASQHKLKKVIYNYADFSNVKPLKPREFYGVPDKSFLLTVAQHRKNKNLDLLFSSFANLKNNHLGFKETQLIIVGGNGPETTNLMRKASDLSIGNSLIFLSGLGDGELRWLYENCSIFIIASSSEGFCLPLVEALCLGCSVVCSDIPIFREVGTSSCSYFSLHDNPVQNLSVQISNAHLRKSRYAVHQKSRYTRDSVAQELISLYNSVTDFSEHHSE